MATRVLFKRNNNSGVIPAASALVQGELAMNTADGKVFLKKEDDTILDITKTTFERDTSITANDDGGVTASKIVAKVDNVTEFEVTANGTEFVNDVRIKNQKGLIFNDGANTNTVTIKGPDTVDYSYEVKLPSFQPIDRSVLSLDGQGNLEWGTPDSFGGNRVYVSDRKGNDDNDGINAPVRTLTRGAQIAASLGLRPLTDPGQGKFNAKRLLEANRSFIQSQVIKWIDANFVNFTYDTAKCERDLGIIIDSVALDFAIGTNYKSVVAGRAYRRANAYTVVQDQILQTKYAILQAQQEGLSSVSTSPTALERYNLAFGEIVDILENDIGDDSTDAIVFPSNASTSTEEIAAKDKLQANKTFLKEEVIAWINTNYSDFTYDAVKCARDTGFLLDAAGYDMVLDTNYNSVVAGRAYLRANSDYLQDNQKMQTMAAFNYAKTQALLSVGSGGLGAFVDGSVYTAGPDYTNVGFLATYTTNSLSMTKANWTTTAGLNELAALPVGSRIKLFVPAPSGPITTIITLTSAWVDNGTTYDATASMPDVFDDFYAYSVTMDAAVANPAAQRIELAFGEILDIIANGPLDDSTDAIVFTEPSSATQDQIDAKNQLQGNKQFLADEVTAWINNQFVGYTYAGAVQTKCERDLGIIIDAAGYDAALGTNYNAVTAGLAYQRANSSYVIAGQNLQTIAGIEYAQALSLTSVAANTTTVTKVNAAFNEVLDIFKNGVVSTETAADALEFNIPTTASQATINAKNQLVQNRPFIKAEIVAYVNANTPPVGYDSVKCARDVGFIVDALTYDLLYGGNSASIQAARAYFEGATGQLGTGQESATIAAYNYLKTILSQIVQGQVVTPNAGNVTPQITAGGNATTSEGTLLGSLVQYTIDVITAGDTSGLPTATQPSLSWVNVNVVAARNQLNSDKASIITQTSTYLFDTFDSFTYNSTKCARDVGYIVDALSYDILYGGNSATTTAASAYWVGTTTQVNDQIFQTTKAYEHLSAIAQQVVVDAEVTTSPGFSGTSQNLSLDPASATEVTRVGTLVEIVSDVVRLGLNGLPVVTYPDVSFADVGLKDARLELVADRQTIIDGTINFVKTTYQDFVYDNVRCARDVGYIVDGLSYDILYSGNSATVDTARAYWVTLDGVTYDTQVPGQESVTALAIDRLAYLTDKVVRGVTVTDVYQTAVAQVTSGSNATTTEADALTSLLGIISGVIVNGIDTLPSTIDPDLSWVAGGISSAYSAFRITNRTAIIGNVITYISDTFTGFVYNSATCSRDTGLILDAVILDFILGGNERTVEAGNAYYEVGNTSAALVVGSQRFETAEANRYAKRIAKQIVQNQTITPFFTPVGGEPTQVKYPSITGAAAVNDIETLFNTVIGIFEGGAIPTIVANSFQQVPITISVAAGDFYIDNPIIIPDLCSVVGDSLRSVVVRPLNAGKDMFRIRNGAYMTGFTFRDGLDANLVPSYTFNWCVAFDDPSDDSVDRQGYFGLRRDKPRITLSPYIQNCSIISFLGGNGIWVDGAKVREFNVPINPIEAENPVEGDQPPQGKSMVANAFTMVSFGGTGWLVTNDGYAQIVSCFQIFCLNGSYAQSGGYLSITNSATNFGVYALRSSGFSPLAFNFDRGFVAATGTSGGRISLTTLGTEREPIAQYVLKFRNATTDADVTSNFKTASTEISFDSSAFNAIADRTGTITNIAGSGPYTATLTGVTTTGIVTGKYLTKTSGDGVLGSLTTVTAVRSGANEIDISSNGPISAGVGVLVFGVGGALNPISNIITLPDHGFLNGDSVYYYADINISGNAPALGLIDNGIYFVKVISANTLQLFNDNGLAYVADIQAGGVGTQRLAKNVEEFFVEKILSSHNSYQTLVLPESTPDYVFGVGTPITGTTGAFTNNAYVLSWTPATRELVVSNQLTTVGEEQQRIKFTVLSTITADQSTYTGIPLVSVTDRSDLYTTVFTTNSTRTASEILNPSGTIGFKCNFHRPSIVNSSSHTWEYAGSGTDYNALPQNGGTTILAYQQYTELPGRVYSSGTNEIGDFLVGDFIKAENNTGKITFRTEVTVGQLNVLRLSLSSIEISSISSDTGLGDNEIGGASDSRLTTQKAIRSFINNRLGNVLDKNVSTNAVAGALVQLNSSGQINVDLIPPLRGVTTYASTTYGGRLLLSEKIPSVEVSNGDNASETYQQQTLTLTGGTLTAVVGDLITQNGTTGSGRVKEAVTGGTSVTLYGVTGTFSDSNAAQTIRKNGTTVTGVYPSATTTVVEIVDNYFLNNDTSSQFLLLDGSGYTFTVGSTITSAIGLAQGEITEYRPGVLYGLNLSSLIGGSLYTPVSGAVTYTDVALTNISGTGTGATADITVTNGAVTDVTIISGGSGYTTSSVLSASSASIGGTGSGFQINANRADTRLYVDLVGNKTKFNATGAVNDYFEDNNAPVVTISNLATFTTLSFNAASIGGGGDVNTGTSRITLTGHGLTNSDILIYSNQSNVSVGGLTNNRGYFIKVIDANTVELYTNYSLGAADQVLLTSSSSGTHTLTRNVVSIGSTSLSFFYKAAHGFSTGDTVLVEGADLPAGLSTGAYYFVGSVSTNTFTLHNNRTNALASVGGLTLSKVAVTDIGSGSATLTIQNVSFNATVNNSSRLSNNWGTVSVSSLDASNIVSGVFASSRLASAGTANTQTFLRGDSSWSYAVQGIRKNAGSSISLTGDNYADGADTIYYNQPILDIDKVDGDSGTPNFSNLGVAAFDKTQFAVGKPSNIPIDTGNVSIKPGVIDAGFLSGQPGTYYTNPDNFSKAVPVLKGGTGLTTYLEGDLLYAGSGGSLTQLAVGGISTVLSSNGVIPAWVADLNLAGGVTAGNALFNSDINSTDTSTGALKVIGGAGITKNLYVGGSLSVAGSINFNSSLSITGDNAVIVLSPGGVGTVSIQPAGITTIGTLGVQTTLVGNLSATGNQQTINFSPTGSTSAVTINSAGTLTLGAAAAGGISVTTDITLAGDIAVNGGDITTTATTFNLLNATATTVNFAGAATALTIGASNSGTTTVRNNLTVTGDLTLNGTNSTINATSVTIRDNAIQLANTASPTNAIADGGGIILKGTTDHSLLWDVTNTNWTSSEHFNIVTGKSFKVDNVAVLSATALGSTVVGSSLTSVGTLTGGTWNSTVIAGQYGGTGVANTGKTITVAGNLTTTGAFNTTINVTNTTSVALPTSGTLIGTNDTGTVSTAMLAGSIPNSKLANSTITLNGSVVNLGDTVTVTATLANNLTVGTGLSLDSGTTFNGSAARTLTVSSAVATLTGTQVLTNKTFTDSSTTFQDDGDNTKKMTFQLSSVAANTTRTLTVPNVDGTIVTTGDTGSVSNTMLAGSIANGKLTNSTISGIALGSNLNSLTAGSFLTWSVGTTFNGSAASTLAVDATNANTGSKVVARDASGNFSAGTITASLTGLASAATNVRVSATDYAGNTASAANTVALRDASSDIYANLFRGTATTARYADLAENYLGDVKYEAGTVVMFGGDAEVTLATDGTRRVAGVVSTNPAHLMNEGLQGDTVIALALQGRVPCKVTGKIRKGDMLVAAGNGYARAEEEPKFGQVIGKALEDFDGESGVIEVVVGRM